MTKSFKYDNKRIRTVEIDGGIWFYYKDVCDMLEISDVNKAIDTLCDNEKQGFFTGCEGIVDIINEAGLYKLIFDSNKPEAKGFERWVTRDVLSLIRRKRTAKVYFDPVQSARAVFEALGINKSTELAFALDKVYQNYTGQSALEILLNDPDKNTELKHNI